jgi:hypothetical protein
MPSGLLRMLKSMSIIMKGRDGRNLRGMDNKVFRGSGKIRGVASRKVTVTILNGRGEATSDNPRYELYLPPKEARHFLYCLPPFFGKSEKTFILEIRGKTLKLRRKVEI